MIKPRRRRPARNPALAGLLVVVAGVLFWLPSASFFAANTKVLIALNNFAHLPLFSAMALVLFGLSVIVFGHRFDRRATHYRLALAGSGVLAVATELVQFFGPRDADLGDVLLDMIGAAAALAVLATLDPRLAGSPLQRPWIRRGVRLASMIAVIVAFVPVLLWAEAYRQRDERFPVICSFQDYWERKTVRVNAGKLEFTRPPAEWERPPGDRVGRLTGHVEVVTGFSVIEPYPDWRGYDSLRLDLYSGHDAPFEISITISDETHNREYTDRFTGRYVVPPGPSEIVIDLEQVRTAPKTREMDMAQIDGMVIYNRKPPESFTMYLDNLRLETAARPNPRTARQDAEE